jgi:hypothetical protein
MTDKFSKPILRNLRTSLQDILKAECFGDKIPFEYTLGNCSFDEDQAKFQLIVTFKGNSVEDIAKKKQKEDLEHYAKYFDIDLERKHPRYTLVGYKIKSRKLPWIITDNQKSGEYIISDDQAQKLFGKQDVDTFLKGQREAQANG